jgi:hypothetical protein
MDAWGPMFAVRMHIPPHRLADLSVLQMVDHVDYLDAMRGPADGG